MPVYFTLQEALTASQTAHKDYTPRISGGREVKTTFVQKDQEPPRKVLGKISEEPGKIQDYDEDIIPYEKPKPPPPPAEDVNKAERERLQRQKEDLQRKKRDAEQKNRAEVPKPNEDLYKEPPSSVHGLAVVKIDQVRQDRQRIESAEEVQKVYEEQNALTGSTKKAKEWVAKAKTTPSKALSQTILGLENLIRHPVYSIQKMVREPFEKRDIAFASAVARLVKDKLFPNMPELPMKMKADFIKYILQKGKEKRNTTKGTQFVNAMKDLGISLTPIRDTRQRRAIEWLMEQLVLSSENQTAELKNWLETVKQDTINYVNGIGDRFSLTVCKGDEPLKDQSKFDSRILFDDENRKQIQETAATKNVERLIKEKIKPIVQRFNSLNDLTVEEKLELIKYVYTVYKDNNLISEEDLKKGELANGILPILGDILKYKNYHLQGEHWDKLRLVLYDGDSHGEALGGAKKFTKNQELALKAEAARDKKESFAASGLYTAATTSGEIVGYLAGYGVAYGIGVAKGIPRAAVGSAVVAGGWWLGPVWSGIYAGIKESQDIHIGKINIESRTSDLQRRVSREKALFKEGQLDKDMVRNDLEKACVTAIPAAELTKNINNIILTDPDNGNSETKNLTREQVLDLMTQIAHAKARLDLTMESGSKEMNYKTQNWVSYHEGQEQIELANLRAAILQANWRLYNLMQDQSALTENIPFLEKNPENLESTIENFSTIVRAGLIEGLPSALVNGGSPLSTLKSSNFYKQIFDASGIEDPQILAKAEKDVDTFIESLKISEIGGKKMNEWLAYSESLREHEKILTQIKKQRALVASTTAFTTSLAMGGLKQAAHAIGQGFDQGGDQAPDTSQAPSVDTGQKPPDVQLNINQIFSHDSKGTNEVTMFLHGESKTVNIPLAEGLHLKQDNLNHSFDIVDNKGHVVYNDFLIDRNNDGDFEFNDQFKLNDHSQPVNLNDYFKLDTKVEEKVVVPESSPIDLYGGPAIVDYLKEHYKDAMTTIAHRDVIKGEHALTTFVDSQGKIHITQGGYTAPNAFSGQADSLSAGMEGGNGSLFFSFGTNAERANLSHEGILVHLTWREKGDGGYGEYVFDPRNPGNTPQEQLLAQLINQDKLMELAKDRPGDWLREGDLAELWKGVRGYEGGYTSVTSDGLKMHDFEMEFAHAVGDTNLTIASPEIKEEITQIIIEPSSETIPIPQIPPEASKVEPPVVIETQPFNTFPGGPYYSPQLLTTLPPRDIPAATPLPATVINELNFKQEKKPTTIPTHQQAFDFINNLERRNLPPVRNPEEIDNHIYTRVFTPSQQDFLKNEGAELINRTVIPGLMTDHRSLYDKLDRRNPQGLTNEDKTELKNYVLQKAKEGGLSEKQALTVYEFLVQRSYYDNMLTAVKEKKLVDTELRRIDAELQRFGPAHPSPSRPQPPRKSKTNSREEKEKKEKKIDDFIGRLLREYPDLTTDNFDEKDDVINELFNFVQDLAGLTNEQRKFLTSGKAQTVMDKMIDELDKTAIMISVKSFKPLTKDQESQFSQIIERVLKKNNLTEDETEVLYSILSQTIQIRALINERLTPESRVRIDQEEAKPKIKIGDSEPIKIDIESIPEAREDESLSKYFEDYGKLTNKANELKKQMEAIRVRLQKSGDEFAYLSNSEYLRVSDEEQKTKEQIDRIDQDISTFEIEKLPAILGGAFDTIVANPNDQHQEVHGYYYSGFSKAFRQYMIDYISKDKNANNQEIRKAFNKLKNDLRNIDPKVKLIEFDEFIKRIIAVL